MYATILKLAAILLAGVAGENAAADPKPNLVVILADDLGYADVGFNGATDIRTPFIDQIASKGVRCTNGYVTHAFCSPSRAGLLTGRYQQRFGHEQNVIFSPTDPNMGLPRSQRTLADVLGTAGYFSGAIGKWHLGAHRSLHPMSRGFDSFYGMLGGSHEYFPSRLTIVDPEVHEDGYRTKLLRDWDRVDEAEYLTDGFSREAADFIDRHSDQPFFLYLAYNAPHTPMQVTPEYRDRYPDIKDKRRQTYAGMVSAVDDGVGRVLEALERNGLLNRTLIYFLSDNGGPTDANASRNDPLRAGKGHVYEGGVRVPFAVRWDGVLPAGVDYHEPVSSLDIFATAIALAGAEPPEGQSLDGVNLIPYLTDQTAGRPHDVLYWRMKRRGRPIGRSAIRLGDDKLVENERDAYELFNLADDRSETNDLREAEPEVFEKLRSARDAWYGGLVEPAFLGLSQLEQYKKQLAQAPPDRAGRAEPNSAR